MPAEWIEQATSKQVSNGSDPSRDWDLGYGFQFWRCRHDAYRGDGKDGQFCILLPKLDAVIAIKANTGDMQAELNVVWEKLLPAFHDEARMVLRVSLLTIWLRVVSRKTARKMMALTIMG